MSDEKTKTGIVTTCIVCGAEFPSASGKKLYCSSRCWYRRNRDRHVPRVTKTCPVCGKTFVGTPRRGSFCSRACRSEAYYEANKKEIRAYLSLYRVAFLEKLETSSEAYAKFRSQRRIQQRKYYAMVNPGCKPYRPNPRTWIPDWAVKGQDVLDRRSVFLPGNMSDEKVIAANAFNYDTLAAEETHHPHVKTIFRSR